MDKKARSYRRSSSTSSSSSSTSSSSTSSSSSSINSRKDVHRTGGGGNRASGVHRKDPRTGNRKSRSSKRPSTGSDRMKSKKSKLSSASSSRKRSSNKSSSRKSGHSSRKDYASKEYKDSSCNSKDYGGSKSSYERSHSHHHHSRSIKKDSSPSHKRSSPLGLSRKSRKQTSPGFGGHGIKRGHKAPSSPRDYHRVPDHSLGYNRTSPDNSRPRDPRTDGRLKRSPDRLKESPGRRFDRDDFSDRRDRVGRISPSHVRGRELEKKDGRHSRTEIERTSRDLYSDDHRRDERVKDPRADRDPRIDKKIVREREVYKERDRTTLITERDVQERERVGEPDDRRGRYTRESILREREIIIRHKYEDDDRDAFYARNESRGSSLDKDYDEAFDRYGERGVDGRQRYDALPPPRSGRRGAPPGATDFPDVGRLEDKRLRGHLPPPIEGVYADERRKLPPPDRQMRGEWAEEHMAVGDEIPLSERHLTRPPPHLHGPPHPPPHGVGPLPPIDHRRGEWVDDLRMHPPPPHMWEKHHGKKRRHYHPGWPEEERLGPGPGYEWGGGPPPSIQDRLGMRGSHMMHRGGPPPMRRDHMHTLPPPPPMRRGAVAHRKDQLGVSDHNDSFEKPSPRNLNAGGMMQDGEVKLSGPPPCGKDLTAIQAQPTVVPPKLSEPPPPLPIEKDNFSDFSDDSDDILNQVVDSPPKDLLENVKNEDSASKVCDMPSYEAILEEEERMDLEEISDEEFEEEKQAKYNVANVLDIDWSCLIRDSRPPPPPIYGSALKRFRPLHLLARLGVSTKYARFEVLKEVEKRCLDTETKKNEAANKAREDASIPEQKVEGEKISLKTEPVESEGVKIKVENTDEGEMNAEAQFEVNEGPLKAEILSPELPSILPVVTSAGVIRYIRNMGPPKPFPDGIQRRALCAREDMALRRRMCNLPEQDLIGDNAQFDSMLFKEAAANLISC